MHSTMCLLLGAEAKVITHSAQHHLRTANQLLHVNRFDIRMGGRRVRSMINGRNSPHVDELRGIRGVLHPDQRQLSPRDELIAIAQCPHKRLTGRYREGLSRLLDV